MDFNTERENNIIKNIAKEIVFECAQIGLEVTQDLANYMVKLILLNPKNGFTASEVMPRSLTQELVLMVVEELKQDTPEMNCIRMQVYWESVKLNVAELKKEYQNIMTEKSEPHMSEILSLEKEDSTKMLKHMASYILVYMNLGSPNVATHMRETVAAFHSIFKSKEATTFFSNGDEEKMEDVKKFSKRTTGIRMFLKNYLKAAEGIEDVKKISSMIETLKEDVIQINSMINVRVEDIRETIANVVSMDFFLLDPYQMADIYLPPECDFNDLKYTKKILCIMLQHGIYMNDIQSVLEEIDGSVILYLEEHDDIVNKLSTIMKNRETVPTTEVYSEFDRLGEIWWELQSYQYCIQMVQKVIEDFSGINKKEYFTSTHLEKVVLGPVRAATQKGRKKSVDGEKYLTLTHTVMISDDEEVTVEFNGFCAWTLYFTNGLLIPGNPQVPIHQFRDMYFSFSSKNANELWVKKPQFYIMQIYEYVRNNPELVELLKLYDALYKSKNLHLTKKIERTVAIRTNEAQTVLHPIEKHWDKDYAFSIWELKKKALTLSRLVKCVTKSVQTVSPHSHFRASIGLLAAPDKDKEAQTKRDNSCVHPTIARYLYGLRGHEEDMFRVIDLTRPIEETYQRVIELGEKPTCKERREAARNLRPQQQPFLSEPCRETSSSDDKCDYYYGYDSKTDITDNTETAADTYYLEYNAEG